MAETLFIELGDNPTWFLTDDGGHIIREGDAEDLKAHEEDFHGEVVALVPARETLRTTAEVPSKQYRQIIQAVPYVVEEQLAEDVEDCFFALGGRTPSGAIEVVVVSHANMEGWQAQLAEMDLSTATMLPASELVPWTGGVDALIDGDRSTLRWGEGAALETDTTNLAVMIGLIPVEQRAHINIYTTEADQALITLQLSELNASEENPPEVHQLDASAREWRFHNFLKNNNHNNLNPVNLLQGEYKTEVKKRGPVSVWRSVAVLAICGVLLHLGSLVGQGMYMTQQAEAYRDAYRTLYSEVFPSDRNVRDYRRRWNSHLGKSSGEGNDFIALFAQASQGLEAAGLTLNNVNFNESRGDLILQVVGQRSEVLVEYAQALSSQGLNAEIGTISQDGSAVRGSIKVKSGGAS